VSADLLRRAAAGIREDAPTPELDGFMRAVADWLDGAAKAIDQVPVMQEIVPTTVRELQAALAVARAYLGEDA
jgi:hypothetical protein